LVLGLLRRLEFGPCTGQTSIALHFHLSWILGPNCGPRRPRVAASSLPDGWRAVPVPVLSSRVVTLGSARESCPQPIAQASRRASAARNHQDGRESRVRRRRDCRIAQVCSVDDAILMAHSSESRSVHCATDSQRGPHQRSPPGRASGASRGSRSRDWLPLATNMEQKSWRPALLSLAESQIAAQRFSAMMPQICRKSSSTAVRKVR
jgi:hypothetical protein